jgi:hypothetical protein
MLPQDFTWQERWQYANGELALLLHGKQVALLLRKANGVDWYALLDCQQPMRCPALTRPCSSLEAGKAGVEAWAARHEARLRAEVARGLQHQRG